MGGNIMNDRCCDVWHVTGIKHSRDERVHIERERKGEHISVCSFFFSYYFFCLQFMLDLRIYICYGCGHTPPSCTLSSNYRSRKKEEIANISMNFVVLSC